MLDGPHLQRRGSRCRPRTGRPAEPVGGRPRGRREDAGRPRRGRPGVGHARRSEPATDGRRRRRRDRGCRSTASTICRWSAGVVIRTSGPAPPRASLNVLDDPVDRRADDHHLGRAHPSRRSVVARSTAPSRPPPRASRIPPDPDHLRRRPASAAPTRSIRRSTRRPGSPRSETAPRACPSFTDVPRTFPFISLRQRAVFYSSMISRPRPR